MIVAHQPNFTPVRINPSGEESSAANIKKIFLAEDDDEDFNLFNAAILTIKSSIQVMRIKNGIMFSSLIETSLKPDIIILDLNMPYKNGLMCLQEVKSKQHLKSVKVIIYSTSSSLRDIENCYASGADYYLVKPDNYHSIIQQFKDLFSNEYFINNVRPPRNRFVFNSNLLSGFFIFTIQYLLFTLLV